MRERNRCRCRRRSFVHSFGLAFADDDLLIFFSLSLSHRPSTSSSNTIKNAKQDCISVPVALRNQRVPGRSSNERVNAEKKE